MQLPAILQSQNHHEKETFWTNPGHRGSWRPKSEDARAALESGQSQGQGAWSQGSTAKGLMVMCLLLE